MHSASVMDAESVIADMECEPLPPHAPHVVQSIGDTSADDLLDMTRQVGQFLPRTPRAPRSLPGERARFRALAVNEAPIVDRIALRPEENNSALVIVQQILCAEEDPLCRLIGNAMYTAMFSRLYHAMKPDVYRSELDQRSSEEYVYLLESTTADPNVLLAKVLKWKREFGAKVNATVATLVGELVTASKMSGMPPCSSEEEIRRGMGLLPDLVGRQQSLRLSRAINEESVAAYWHRYWDNDAPQGRMAIARVWSHQRWAEFSVNTTGIGGTVSVPPVDPRHPKNCVTIADDAAYSALQDVTRGILAREGLAKMRVTWLRSEESVLRCGARLSAAALRVTSRTQELLKATGALEA
eukprot:Polyplicarium_translucidae@DN3320_c2_g1_i3.p1